MVLRVEPVAPVPGIVAGERAGRAALAAAERRPAHLAFGEVRRHLQLDVSTAGIAADVGGPVGPLHGAEGARGVGTAARTHGGEHTADIGCQTQFRFDSFSHLTI